MAVSKAVVFNVSCDVCGTESRVAENDLKLWEFQVTARTASTTHRSDKAGTVCTECQGLLLATLRDALGSLTMTANDRSAIASGATAPATEAAEARAWAVAQGKITAGQRGRLSGEVWAAWKAAQAATAAALADATAE